MTRVTMAINSDFEFKPGVPENMKRYINFLIKHHGYKPQDILKTESMGHMIKLLNKKKNQTRVIARQVSVKEAINILHGFKE